MKVELHPEAEIELYEAAAWYDDQRTGLGDDLLAEITRWLDVIAEAPSIWPKWPDAPDLDPPKGPDRPVSIRHRLSDAF